MPVARAQISEIEVLDSPPADVAPEVARRERGSRLSYAPGIDGLRAVAVVAVLLYHAGLSGTVAGLDLTFPGGFLGVEVFFVVSGYLITSLLLSEWKSDNRVSLGTFWMRRARRLLPALFLLLAVVMGAALLLQLVSGTFATESLVANQRGDALSAIFYVTNWNFIIGTKSYFEAIGRPPLFRHLWSLSVEEQFYLFWPLIFTFCMKRMGRRGLLKLVLIGSLASALLMGLLHDPEPGRDPSRVFMGTDTRASALLLGCALAFIWPQARLRKKVRAGAVIMLDTLGLLGMAGLVALFLTMDEFANVLYPWGFLACSGLSVAVIATAVHPAAHVGPLLGNRLFKWVGLRSYGIYLWHWPIFQLTRPQLDVPLDGVPLLAGRFGLTFFIAELSYRYVEMPIRRGVLGRTWREMRTSVDKVRRRALAARYGFGTLAVLFTVTCLVFFSTKAEVRDQSYILNQTASDLGATTTLDLAATFGAGENAGPGTTATPGTSVPGPVPGSVPGSVPGTDPASSTTLAAPVVTTPPKFDKHVAMLGDSVMLGAKQQLVAVFENKAAVEAAQNRQVADGIGVLTYWQNSGWLAKTDVVVVHLGTNGTFTDGQFDQMMQILQQVPEVLFLNDRVPGRRWQDSNNVVIAAGVARYPGKAILVDWVSASAPHPEFFYNDGTHLQPAGAQFYAELIRQAV